MNWTNYSDYGGYAQGTPGCFLDQQSQLSLYVAISTFGIVGNMAFVFVVLRIQRLHTPTNMYLANLAVADFTYVCLIWSYLVCVGSDGAACPLLYDLIAHCTFGMLIDASLSTSLVTVLLISVDRYLAIKEPIKYRLFAGKRSKNAVMILLTWTFGLLVNLPTVVDCYGGLVGNVITLRLLPGVIYLVLTISFMLCVLILYVLAAVQLKKAATNMSSARQNRRGDDKYIIKVCIATALVFFLCTCPRAMVLIVEILDVAGDGVLPPKVTDCLHNISSCFLLLNSTLNPFVYNIVSQKYRLAFKEAFIGNCSKTAQSGRPQPITLYRSQLGTRVSLVSGSSATTKITGINVQ